MDYLKRTGNHNVQHFATTWATTWLPARQSVTMIIRLEINSQTRTAALVKGNRRDKTKRLEVTGWETDGFRNIRFRKNAGPDWPGKTYRWRKTADGKQSANGEKLA